LTILYLYTVLHSHLDISQQFTDIWPQKCNKTSTKSGRGAEEFSQSPPPVYTSGV